MGLVQAESSGQGNFHSLFGSCRTHTHTKRSNQTYTRKTSVSHIISYVEVFSENACTCERTIDIKFKWKY